MNTENGLKEFYCHMKLVLDEHQDRKGDSWTADEVQWLEQRLEKEMEEFRRESNPLKKAQELVDVANFCMFIYHKYIDIWAEAVGKIFDKRS